MLGDFNDKEYITMKDYNKFPEEMKTHRWVSNNSIFAEVGKTDYSKFVDNIALNGEPGIVWLDNMRKYGRLIDGVNYKDKLVAGCNPCLTRDTIIFTNEGPKKIEELLDKKIVVIVDGEEFNATNFYYTGDREVFELSTIEGFSIKSTFDHKFMTKNGWKKLSELSIGDKIVINRHRNNIEWNGSGNFGEGYVLGTLVGDGRMCGKDKNRIAIDIWKKDIGCEGIKNEIDKVVQENKWNYYEDREMFSLSNSSLHSIFRKFNSTKEKMSKEYEFTSSEFHKGFLRGIFDTNGCIIGDQSKGVSIRVSQTSYSTLEIIQRMLIRFGIFSKIYKNRKNAGYRLLPDGHGKYKKYFCKANHELVISKDNILLFKNLINFSHIEKKNKLEEKLLNYKRNLYSTKFVVEINSINFCGIEDVYDTTVEEIQAFDANGFYVHNCSEQSLESMETCLLTETFPALHDSYEEYQETLKYAYLYAKTITLIPTHWPETNAVMMKNRRIGMSQTGIIDAFVKHGRREMLEWCENGYKYLRELDEKYSNWLCIPKSIKITSIKPSGTVSQLAGVSPGIHYPHSEYYIRRIRIASNSPLLEPLLKANYNIVDEIYGTEETKKNTKVLEFPVYTENFLRKKEDVTIWEQIKNVIDYQRFWADNNVSVTVTFKQEESKDICKVLEAYEDQLKAISFLPISEHGYDLAPYEEITKEQYEKMTKNLKKPDFSHITSIPVGEKYCTNDSCEIPGLRKESE
jgi:intein/homing endonuclease